MKKKPKTANEVLLKVRNEWPVGIKPFTKVEPDKTKYNRKEKHKKSPEGDFGSNK